MHLTLKTLVVTSLLFSSFIANAQTDEELGPWLDLRNGGIATGPAQGKVLLNPDGTSQNLVGGLVNGTLLPKEGPYFRRITSEEESYGTGMMISLLTNATTHFGTEIWPGYITAIGEIAHKEGGYFSPHSSHQNGLDADIPYIGTRTYQSVIGNDGKIKGDFLFTQNWEFWRSLYRQKVYRNGQPTSVVSMILVGPRVKAALCEWAQANKMFDDPENVEIMRKVRPTEGHDDHFHLRIHCSPYHPDCVDGGAKNTLCD